VEDVIGGSVPGQPPEVEINEESETKTARQRRAEETVRRRKLALAVDVEAAVQPEPELPPKRRRITNLASARFVADLQRQVAALNKRVAEVEDDLDNVADSVSLVQSGTELVDRKVQLVQLQQHKEGPPSNGSTSFPSATPSVVDSAATHQHGAETSWQQYQQQGVPTWPPQCGDGQPTPGTLAGHLPMQLQPGQYTMGLPPVIPQQAVQGAGWGLQPTPQVTNPWGLLKQMMDSLGAEDGDEWNHGLRRQWQWRSKGGKGAPKTNFILLPPFPASSPTQTPLSVSQMPPWVQVPDVSLAPPLLEAFPRVFPFPPLHPMWASHLRVSWLALPPPSLVILALSGAWPPASRAGRATDTPLCNYCGRPTQGPPPLAPARGPPRLRQSGPPG
jgi:hypothetical protein